MAKAKKGPAARALAAAKRVGPEEFGAQQADQLRVLTERYFVLKEQLARDAVETMREIGELIERGADLLPRGHYGKWLDETLNIGRTSAANYRRVAALGRSTPAVFLAGKTIGPSKIIRLSRVLADKRKVALAQTLRGKGVRDMTDAEFAQVTKKYLEKRRRVTGNMRAHGLRMKVQAMTDTLRGALSLPPAENRETRLALCSDLAALIRAAQAAHKKTQKGVRRQ